MATFGKGPKATKSDHTNHILSRHLDPVHPSWTKFGMDILLNLKNKPVEEFFFFLKIQDGRRAGGQKLNFDKISAQKSPFGLANGSWQMDLYRVQKQDGGLLGHELNMGEVI